MAHDHSHHHHDRPTPERALWIAIVLNAAFLVLEAGIGWWTNSLALLADAGHMVSDVGALIVALIAVKIRHHQPSDEYTFGLRRAPVLGGLANGISLVVIVVLISIEAASRFADPPELDAMAVLWTGVAGLVVNLASAWYLARSRDQSVNTRGAMLHLLADALGSVAAIVSALAILLWSFPLADPIASVIIAALLLLGSLPLLRDTVRILLQRAPDHLEIAKVKARLMDDSRVTGVEDLHLWELDSGDTVLTGIVRVCACSLRDANELADDLRVALRETFSITHTTLECRHPDAGGCGSEISY